MGKEREMDNELSVREGSVVNGIFGGEESDACDSWCGWERAGGGGKRRVREQLRGGRGKMT